MTVTLKCFDDLKNELSSLKYVLFHRKIVKNAWKIAELRFTLYPVGVCGGHFGNMQIKKMPQPKFNVIIRKW